MKCLRHFAKPHVEVSRRIVTSMYAKLQPSFAKDSYMHVREASAQLCER